MTSTLTCLLLGKFGIINYVNRSLHNEVQLTFVMMQKCRVRCHSAMEEIPETIVLGTQYTKELNHHTSSVLREYHFRSKVAFDISRIKAFYLIFHIKNHYYFGVVINLKFIVGYAVDTFG